ncbi:unnamed protein product [Rhizoctonia solani]|uniref:Uncharacterized protein n=1 Tax=Rhizoctonia solani TaxID=456999 RepID=A0A8H2WPP3_9AGAM|nr:unnamed protein product [Rhizoctonia solani]
MLGLGSSLNENNWDPEVVPDLHPMFNKGVSDNAQAKEAALCSDIHSFFKTNQQSMLGNLELGSTAKTQTNAYPESKEVPPVPTNKAFNEAASLVLRPTIILDKLSLESLSSPNEELPAQSHQFAFGLQAPVEDFDISSASPSPSLLCGTLSLLPHSPKLQPGTVRLGDQPFFEDSLIIPTFEDVLDLSLDIATCIDNDSNSSLGLHLSKVSLEDILDTRLALFHNHTINLKQDLSGLKNLDTLVTNWLRELQQSVILLKTQLDKDMKCGKKKVNPQDIANVPALLDYCILAEQLFWEGNWDPET